jgi:hypothetical protein
LQRLQIKGPGFAGAFSFVMPGLVPGIHAFMVATNKTPMVGANSANDP